MTLYRYIRDGRLAASNESGQLLVDRESLVGFAGRAIAPAGGLTVLRRRLRERLLDGDEHGAWNIADGLFSSGARTPESVLLDLVSASLREIGEGWANGELSVADEHVASAVASRLIGRMGGKLSPSGHKNGVIVLATPSGEQHGMPVTIAANVLRWRGYSVHELGADTPPRAVADAAGIPGVVAVGLTCSGSRGLGALNRTIRGTRSAASNVLIFLGGRAIVDLEHARSFGADAYSGRRADELVGLLDSRL